MTRQNEGRPPRRPPANHDHRPDDRTAPLGASDTGLQVWARTLVDALADARASLDLSTYSVLVDLLLRRLTREAVDLELDLWRRAA